jgi:hypothetical protein
MVIRAKPRAYYSVRNSADPSIAQLSFSSFTTLFLSGFRQLRSAGYFDEVFGYSCIDDGDVPGTAGEDAAEYVLFLTRKHLWPVDDRIFEYSEDDVFDLIEFLFDQVSKPISGRMHSYADCGMHWDNFDQVPGRVEYREMVNPLLQSYAAGFELNERGEIMSLAPHGMGKLLEASPPTQDGSVRGRMDVAIDRFQRHGSSIDERRHAVRDLADVLERLRPIAKDVITRKDEADLFELANKFGIRHFNDKQKTNYDQAVWLSWIFYHYLATINACLHFVEKKEKRTGGKSST